MPALSSTSHLVSATSSPMVARRTNAEKVRDREVSTLMVAITNDLSALPNYGLVDNLLSLLGTTFFFGNAL